jgi:hypothetical protein
MANISQNGTCESEEINWFRRRNSKQKLSKSIALACVPFSSLLYISKPFEGSLSRRRSQMFFCAVGLWTIMMAKEEQDAFSAQYFKLKILQFRSGKSCDCTRSLPYNETLDTSKDICPLQKTHLPAPAGIPTNRLFCAFTKDLSFGLLFDGSALINAAQTSEGCDVFVSFPATVVWNGWFLVTPRTEHPDLDPVRFILLAKTEGGSWRAVGSSGYARILVSTALFHTPYAVPMKRGEKVHFDLYRLRLGSIWQSAVVAFALCAAGVARLEWLGKHVASLHFLAWAVMHAVRACHYAAAGQLAGAAVFVALAVMQLGNLFLLRREWWQRMTIWCGA